MTNQHKCSRCKCSRNEECFTRKNKVYKTCNKCSTMTSTTRTSSRISPATSTASIEYENRNLLDLFFAEYSIADLNASQQQLFYSLKNEWENFKDDMKEQVEDLLNQG